MSRPAVAAAFSILVAWLVAGPAVADTQSCADFREAVQKGMKGVILVDLKMKWMEPYSDRTNRIHVDFYFFDTAMNPASRLSGEAEYKVPFAAMEGHVQKITDAALQQIDPKMTTLAH